jgi:hypothetical protein
MIPVDPKNLDRRRYVIVDPEQTDPEQYATSRDENFPPHVFPYGVVANDGRVLWGVVPRRSLQWLLDRMEAGGCYNFWALDGSDPPESYLQAVLGDRADGDESAGWRDAYTVEFGKEQET